MQLHVGLFSVFIFFLIILMVYYFGVCFVLFHFVLFWGFFPCQMLRVSVNVTIRMILSSAWVFLVLTYIMTAFFINVYISAFLWNDVSADRQKPYITLILRLNFTVCMV